MDPAALLDITELRDTLADAIARLPEREKIVIALYYYDQLTLREIGGVPSASPRAASASSTRRPSCGSRAACGNGEAA